VSPSQLIAGNPELCQVMVEKTLAGEQNEAEQRSRCDERDHQRHDDEGAQYRREAVGIPQRQREQQCEHEAGHYGAECVRRIVPRGSREVWIGKETPVIVETE
jgi:hypothetical protein